MSGVAFNDKENLISIHAPARGATKNNNNNNSNNTEFQSTLPRGERPFTVVINDPEGGISIHAPARGATVYRLGF